jgi:hypothetical protein
MQTRLLFADAGDYSSISFGRYLLLSELIQLFSSGLLALAGSCLSLRKRYAYISFWGYSCVWCDIF